MSFCLIFMLNAQPFVQSMELFLFFTFLYNFQEHLRQVVYFFRLIEYLYLLKTQSMYSVILLVSFLFLCSGLAQIHDVIIIGAGIAGISASKVLTQHNISHVILQARNRTGGRIYQSMIEGIPIDIGASFVHSPNGTNAISYLMQKMNWTAIRVDPKETFYYDSSEADPKFVDESYDFKSMLITHMLFRGKMADHDISIKEASQDFIDHIMSKEKPIFRDLIHWHLRLISNTQGTPIDQLSARQYLDDETDYDMLPTGGYWMFLQKLLEKCRPVIKLNHVVTKIDYSGRFVEITTNQGIFYAQKVISSLPLGVLNAGTVTFQPELPKYIWKGLNNFNFGIQNKLIVSFEKAFWKQKQVPTWLYFVSKNGTNVLSQCALTWPYASKPILMLFIGGPQNHKVDNLTNQELKEKVLQFLSPYSKEKFVIREILLTKWHLDPFSRGSYANYKVGGSRKEAHQTRKPVNDKLWMVGDFHSELNGLAQGSFVTGREAAYSILNKDCPQWNIDFFE